MSDELREMAREPEDTVIEALEEMLVEARSGELRSLVWCAVYPERTDTGHAGKLYDRLLFAMIGHMEAMKLDYYFRRRRGK